MRRLVVWTSILLLCGAMNAASALELMNPVKGYESLQDVNEVVGCQLCHPAVMGVEDKAYFSIDCGDYMIGEYDFRVNGRAYMLRASKNVDVDICGIYDESGMLFDHVELPEATIQVYDVTADGTIVSRWISLDQNGIGWQYVLAAFEADEVFAESFYSIASEMAFLTGFTWVEMSVDALIGQYEDTWSQRAMGNIEACDDHRVQITIHWSSSAWEYTEWTMTASEQDGRLVYDDCTCRNICCDENGKVTSEIVHEQGEGWFVVRDTALYWEGAADEQCRECIFAKMEE